VDPAFVQEMRADIEGHITRSPFALDLQAKKPLIREINELFKKQKDNPGGRDIPEAPTRALTAFTVLVDAINRARSTDPGDIRKALVAANVPPEQPLMPWIGVRFDEKGRNIGVRSSSRSRRGPTPRSIRSTWRRPTWSTRSPDTRRRSRPLSRQ
jgi:branched-chain amino acid transport system substrate-binding protein